MGVSQAHAPQTLEATRILGAAIRTERTKRKWTIRELAERVGVSRYTIQHVERGDPGVAVGTVFETATIVGVVLFDENPATRRSYERALNDQLALLPSRVRQPKVDNDF